MFYREHFLDEGLRPFAPDPDIADAWFRLQRSDHVDRDLELLSHEYFESKFEGIFRTNYRTATEWFIRQQASICSLKRLDRPLLHCWLKWNVTDLTEKADNQLKSVPFGSSGFYYDQRPNFN